MDKKQPTDDDVSLHRAMQICITHDGECTLNSPRCIINGDSMSSASGFSTEHIVLVYLFRVALLLRCG